MNITIGRKDGDPLSFVANPDEKVLHAALRSGLTVPYECATGTCGSCRAKLVSGELDDGWADAPGKKALKVARGEFLMCQCVAQSGCTIRIPSPVTQQDPEASVPDHFNGSISEFKQLTSDVMSFSVSLPEEVGFHAGQFMALQLPGVEGTRAYSMVNYSTQTAKLEFVIKHFKGGKCSEWLFDSPEENSRVTLFGPLGHAIFEPQLGHDLLLLSGGSGIAGMMAILEQADQTGYLQTHKIELIFGVRTAEDIFYLSELRRMAVAHPENLLLTIALSDAENDRDTPGLPEALSDLPRNLKIAKGGFVHEHIDEMRITDNTMAFIAGPPPMVDGSIGVLITDCEFEVDRIRYDKFA